QPLDLALIEVEIAAAYDVEAEPPQRVEGVLRGLMPAAAAMLSAGQANGINFVPWSALAGGAGCQVDAMNSLSDIDNHGAHGQGVWLYFNFTAERVQWATDRPEPTQGATTGHTTDSDPSATVATVGSGA